MAKRLSHALGVDIGTHSTKIAAVRMGKDGPVVTGLGMAATPGGTVDHTGIFDTQTLGAALRALIAESGVGVKDVIFCVSGQSSVVVRNLEVPKMTDSELAEHMQWEIQRNIPFAETTIISDFRPIDNPDLANSQNMEVVMAVSPESAITMVLELIKSAGCKPAAIDVEPLGLGRVIKSCHYADLGQKRVCVVHMGSMTTAINMYRDGVLAFPRTVPLGGSMYTKAIADALGSSTEEAEQRKLADAAVPDSAGAASGAFTVPGATLVPGAQPYNPFTEPAPFETPGPVQLEPEPAYAAPAAQAPDASRIFAAIQPHLEEFVAELRRSMDYYKSRGGDVHEIAVSGGGANLRGIESYINRSLGLPVSRLNPFNGIGVEAPAGAETYLQQHASEFSVAVGMGLHIAYD